MPALLAAQSGNSKENGSSQQVTLIDRTSEQKVDVMIDGKLFTSYCYHDSLVKQVLYPVLTSSGTAVTRGWPVNPRPGERRDHPHHIGMWLNYGDVNSYDFWNNSHAVPEDRRKVHNGSIKHVKVKKISSGKKEGVLRTEASWLSPFGNKLLSEKTEYHFIADGSTRIIDRVTTLTADTGLVVFNDTEEGMFAIRVARQLELPSEKERANPVEGGPAGDYRSSEGVTGSAVWSTRAKWMNLFGEIGSEKISLVICDHPKNLTYPTYWHARGYGLFSANPLGVKDFTGGKQSLNYPMTKGKSITFRYRVMISSGNHLTDARINDYVAGFEKKY
ncbi:MAG TPA: PmoA family protein [Agriterribacter sp.]|nr:PmoA family protein [Agriterribacter sp.]